MSSPSEGPGQRPPQPRRRTEAGRDAYTALGPQTIAHVYGEQPGLAGSMSITPAQVEYPVRGRDEVVSAVLDAPPGSVHVVCAAGGYGKTTVALEAAERARSQGRDVWRVFAADAAGLSAGMRALAVRLGAPPERLRLAWSGQEGDAPDLVWQLLADHDRPWLLVIDNADDTHLLAATGERVADGTGWIRRPPPTGKLLVTSRNSNPDTWGRWVRLHPLRDLSTKQAAQVLLDRAGTAAGTPEQAAALAARLGHMPLLLHQAGRYLAHVRRSTPWRGARHNPRTFDEYRAALDERFSELVDGVASDNAARQPRSRVTATWELTLDLLAEQGAPFARPLLRLLAHFADAPIPYAVVLSPSSLAASALFAALTDSDTDQAIDALTDFGLLTRQTPEDGTDDPAAYTVTLHPAIGETIRALDDVRAQRQEYLTLAAGELANAASDHDSRNPAHWPFWQLAASHVHRLCTLATTAGEIPASLSGTLTACAASCAGYAISAGLYTQAETTVSQATAVASALHSEHPAALKLRHQDALLREHRGDLTDAAAGYQAVLVDRERVLGPDHPDTLQTRHNLAGVRAERGDLEGAWIEYQGVFTDRERVLGADHPGTLDTRHNLAGVRAERGELEGAWVEYQGVFTDRERVLGADHPDTLWTRYSLAWVRAQRGDLEGAWVEYQGVFTDRERVLGADHPDTLQARYSLAWVRERRGDLEGAQAEWQAVLDDRERVLGPDHPDTVMTRAALAELRTRQRWRS